MVCRNNYEAINPFPFDHTQNTQKALAIAWHCMQVLDCHSKLCNEIRIGHIVDKELIAIIIVRPTWTGDWTPSLWALKLYCHEHDLWYLGVLVGQSLINVCLILLPMSCFSRCQRALNIKISVISEVDALSCRSLFAHHGLRKTSKCSHCFLKTWENRVPSNTM